MSKKIVIVGGVAGGASAAARLRRLDESAEIIMLERGEYISFANCGLPYYVGGVITDKSSLTLQTPASFGTRFNVDVRIFNEAISIDPEKKTIDITNHKTNENYTESYDYLILSMGAMPIKPPIKGIESSRVFTLRNIPDTYKIDEFISEHNPKSALVVGGGFIGVEMAENLTHRGIKVSIAEKLNQLMPPLDYDIAADVHRYIRSTGIELYLENGVNSITETENGELIVKLDSDEIRTDMVIMAIGVKPESKIASDTGILTNQRGQIVVNEYMQTNFDNIFAVGDATEMTDFVTGEKTFIPLAGPANKQGRIAADNICGLESKYLGAQGSSILKLFDMTIASTGINEKTAKRLNLDYEKSFAYPASHASYYPGATSMLMKIVFENGSGKILGAQIAGFDGVDKRCDVLATAIRAGMTAHDLTMLELCYAPPFNSAKDPVNMAGYTIENIISGEMKVFHWHDIDKLSHDDSVTLLDVRTEREFSRGHIDGFINIPLDSLRDRLTELDKDKLIYVTCQVGVRGYAAVRILMQNGFDAYNLSGGYRLYESIFS